MSKFDLGAIGRGSVQAITKMVLLGFATLVFFVTSNWAIPQSALAYPFWAQQTAPESPREATGRIVCANCHLGTKPTEVEVPQSVLPNTVFEAVVKIPYDQKVQQVVGDGSEGGLNVGAVVVLPPGFKIAPPDRIPEEMKEKVEGLYFQPYKEGSENVVIIGPLPGEQYQEIVFPVLSPDPETDASVRFGKYQIHVGGNRGRGQLYPTGEKTNNNVYTASVAGTITKISNDESGAAVTIESAEGSTVVENIPLGPQLLVSEGEVVTVGQPLTNNPNVGGFGQKDVEVVLQSATRVQALIAFFVLVMLAQVMLVLKKKQVEKVQAAGIEL